MSQKSAFVGASRTGRRTARAGRPHSGSARGTKNYGGRLYPEKSRLLRGLLPNPGYLSLYAKLDKRGTVRIDDRTSEAPPDKTEAVAYATEARGKSSIVLCIIGHGRVLHKETWGAQYDNKNPRLVRSSALKTNGSAVNMFIPLPITGVGNIRDSSYINSSYNNLTHYYAELADVYGVRDASDKNALWRTAASDPPPNHFANLQAFLRRKFRNNTTVAESMADRFLGWVKRVCDDADKDQKPMLWKLRKLTNRRGLRSRREPAGGGRIGSRTTNYLVGKVVSWFIQHPAKEYRKFYSDIADFTAIAGDDHYSEKLDLRFRKIHYNKMYNFPPEFESIGINVLYCTNVKDSSGNDVGAGDVKTLIEPLLWRKRLKAMDVDPLIFHRLFDTRSKDRQDMTLQYIVDVLSGKRNYDDGPVNVAFDNIYIYDFSCNMAYEGGAQKTALDMRDVPMVSDELLPGDVADTHARLDLLSRQKMLDKYILKDSSRRGGQSAPSSAS